MNYWNDEKTILKTQGDLDGRVKDFPVTKKIPTKLAPICQVVLRCLVNIHASKLPEKNESTQSIGCYQSKVWLVCVGRGDYPLLYS